MTARQDYGLEGPHRPIGNQRQKVAVLHHVSGAHILLQRKVIAKQTGAVGVAVGTLRLLLGLWDIRNACGRPDLAMGVRIAGTHHGTAIFENLDVLNVVKRTELLELPSPAIDHSSDIGAVHHGKSQIVFWGKTEHTADSGFGLGDEKIFFVDRAVLAMGQQRREVVVEDENMVVMGVHITRGAPVARAHVTGWIVGELASGAGGFDLALPGALSAVRRDQNPFAGEGIEAAMGLFRPVETSRAASHWL